MLFIWFWILYAPLLFLLINIPLNEPSFHFLAKVKDVIGSNSQNLVINSFAIAILTALLTLLIGVPTALILSAERFLPFKKLFIFFAFLPFWIPTYIVSIVAIQIFGREGFLALILHSLNIPITIPFNIYSIPGVIGALIFSFLPFVVLPVYLSLRSQDKALLDSARMDGTSASIWWRLRLPMSLPIILNSGMIVFILSLIEFPVPEQLQVKTFIVEVYIQFSAFYSPFGALISAIPAILTSALILSIFQYFQSHNIHLPILVDESSQRKSLASIPPIGKIIWCITILMIHLIGIEY